MFFEKCRRHLAEINENYWTHFRFASTSGVKMIVGGLACIIHAFIPALFETTGSSINKSLTEKFHKRADEAAQNPQA